MWGLVFVFVDAAPGKAAAAWVENVEASIAVRSLEQVWAQDEIERVRPVVERLAAGGSAVSIDTRKSEVMTAAFQAGAHMVNDVSALTFDPRSAEVVAASGAPVILMHHPPFTTLIGHMDRQGLEGSEALAQVIRRHPQVERLMCGHLHRPIEARFAGTIAATVPGPAHQVALDLAPDARWVVDQYPHDDVEELDDGRVRVTLAVTALAWLERLLVRLGPAVSVVEAPPGLGDDTRSAAARRILGRYTASGTASS